MPNTELSELSEFFSAVSKEKNENLEKLKTKIESPKSDLSNLFKQLETAHKETSKISEEPPKEKNENLEKLETKITPPNMSLADLFKQLDDAHKETIQITEESLEISEEILSPIEIQPEIIELQPEIIDSVEKTEELEEAPKPDNIIQEIVSALDDMGEKTETKKITELEVLRKEFSKFKDLVIQKMSEIGGGGSVRINDMEDLDTSGREDGDSLIYNSSTNKYTFSSASTPPDFSNQLSLEDSIDGNLLMNGTDSSSTDAGDDFLQESGVNSGRDFEHSVLQSLTSNILPQASGTFDLGSETKRFKNLYLESDTVDIGGATISSDGSGVITISADGATLPVGTKDANDNVLQIGSTTATAAGQAIRLVKFYTQAGGLDTAAATFKFNAGLDNRSVYRAEGHTFLLNDGSTSGDGGTELFQF